MKNNTGLKTIVLLIGFTVLKRGLIFVALPT
jgi:hypothetical protein